jgi:hypothetical protein
MPSLRAVRGRRHGPGDRLGGRRSWLRHRRRLQRLLCSALPYSAATR